MITKSSFPHAATSWSDVFKFQDEDSPLYDSNEFGVDHFAPDVDIDHCIGAALRDPFSAFIIRIPGIDNPVIVHSFTEVYNNAKGSPIGEKLYGVLLGSDANPPVQFKINPKDFFKQVHPSDCLDYDAAWDATSAEEFCSTPVATGSAGKGDMIDLRTAMYLPRFIAKNLLESASQDLSAPEIAIQIMNLLRSRQPISDPDGNPCTTDTFPAEFHSLISWLFHFDGNDLQGIDVRHVIVSPILASSPLKDAYIALHDKFFNHPGHPTSGPATNPSSTANSPLPASVSDQHTFVLQETNANMARIASSLDSRGSSKRGFDKLTTIVKDTLLAAGSADGVHPAPDMSPKGRDIFAAKNDSEAHLLLVNALKRNHHYYARISSAQAKRICSGFWSWDGPNPGGISMLLFCPWNANDAYNLHKESLILHLKTTHQMDSVSLKQLTESDVVIPSGGEDTLNVIRTKKGIWEIFFPDCMVARSLEDVIDHLMTDRPNFERLIHADRWFIAKLLCCIDSRINKWIEMCSLHSENLSYTTPSIIDFSDVISLLQRGMFSFSPLPKCILRLNMDDDRSSAPSDPIDDRDSKKRKKQGVQRIVNENMNPRWKLRQGEDYAKVYGRQDLVRYRPKGCCPRFHIKGYCFDNCKHPHGEITGDKAREMDSFVAKCRECSNNA